MTRPLKDFIDEADRILARPGADTLRHQTLRNARNAFAGADIEKFPTDDPRIAALKAALKPFTRNTQVATGRTTYVLVALSILTMYFVACTTIVHNKGMTLLADIEKLAATDPQRRFAELERQLLAASKSEALRDEASTQAEPVFIVMSELRKLDAEVYHLSYRVNEYTGETLYPAPGMATVAMMLKAPLSALIAGSYLPQQSTTTSNYPCDALKQPDIRMADKGAKPLIEMKPATAVRKVAAANAAPAEKTNAILPETPKAVQNQDTILPQGGSQGMTTPATMSTLNLQLLTQACEVGLRHIAKTMPSVGEWATRIRQSTSNYSLWLVPGLYAALGALIFFMRQILDDERDNPTLDMIFLRIAIAGMAGIVIGWIWNPTAAASAETRSIGASLFIVSFVVGYSIEVFFTTLDKLVVRTTGALSKQSEEPAGKQSPPVPSAAPTAPSVPPAPQEPKPAS